MGLFEVTAAIASLAIGLYAIVGEVHARHARLYRDRYDKATKELRRPKGVHVMDDRSVGGRQVPVMWPVLQFTVTGGKHPGEVHLLPWNHVGLGVSNRFLKPLRRDLAALKKSEAFVRGSKNSDEIVYKQGTLVMVDDLLEPLIQARRAHVVRHALIWATVVFATAAIALGVFDLFFDVEGSIGLRN